MQPAKNICAALPKTAGKLLYGEPTFFELKVILDLIFLRILESV